MQCKTHPYQDNGVDLEAFVAYPGEGTFPLVILCHAWKGRDDFICEKARLLAEQGYVGFALDMYGKGVLGRTKEENASLKQPFIRDRHLLSRRLSTAFRAASSLPHVNVNKIAAIGYGFGGLCALDLARSGLNLKGAVSIYGHFDPPPLELMKTIQARILILHGYLDPLVTQEELLRFEKEMTEAQVDWQAHIYGNAMHAFATPSANDPEQGILYNQISAERAWKAIENFLAALFA